MVYMRGEAIFIIFFKTPEYLSWRLIFYLILFD